METREERITFIKSQNVPVLETKDFTLSNILKWALIKDISLNRLKKHEVDCFGYCDQENENCKKCFLLESNECPDFSEYLKQFKDVPFSDDAITITEWSEEEKDLKIMSLEYSLEKLHFRSENSSAYKIAKIILVSNNKPYGEVIQQIASLIKGSTHDAQVRFYQVRKRIQEYLNLRVSIVTTKVVQINEDKK